MESIKLTDLSKEEIKDTIAKLNERLTIVETNERKIKLATPYNKNEKVICDICGGKYTVRNKAVHFKTDKHKREERYNDTIRRLTRSKTIAGRLNIPKNI